ncbi:MAG TPA: hypothetical protein VIW02_08240 [Gammaproteobacteria bacterium]
MRWDRLNAYVDGELPPDQAAEVAEQVARTPEVARQVAALSALKAAVGDALPACPGGFARALGRRRSRLRLAAVAATLVLGLALSAAWVNELHHPAPGRALALQLHQQWSAARGSYGTSPLQRVGLDALQLAYVPDLAQVQLTFDGVRQVSVRGGRGLHVGYQGPNGCAVSLVVFKQPGHRDEPLAAVDGGGHTAWQWAAGGASFYLLAPKMDPGRLAGIARVVQRLTRARLPLDPAGVLALEQARSGADPCLA